MQATDERQAHRTGGSPALPSFAIGTTGEIHSDPQRTGHPSEEDADDEKNGEIDEEGYGYGV